MDKQNCNHHEEFLIAVTTLSADVKALRFLFKGTMSCLLTVTILLAGLTATFVYKASDLHAQVEVNSVEINNHKELPHGR